MVKEKHRWIFIEVIGEKIEQEELISAINRKINELFGTIYGAKIHYRLIEYNPDNGTGVIRVNLEGLDLLRTTFLFIKTINNKPVLINDALVSGTLKALKEKIHKKKLWHQIQHEIEENSENK